MNTEEMNVKCISKEESMVSEAMLDKIELREKSERSRKKREQRKCEFENFCFVVKENDNLKEKARID